MPLVFTKEEIGSYLTEMGYGVLEQDDLSKFVKDLKRLIKAESKKRRRRRLGHTGHTQSELSSLGSDFHSQLVTETEASSVSDHVDGHRRDGHVRHRKADTTEGKPEYKREKPTKMKKHQDENYKNSNSSHPRSSTSGSSLSAGKLSMTSEVSSSDPDNHERSKQAGSSGRQVLGTSNQQVDEGLSREPTSGSCSELSDTDLLNLMEEILKTEVCRTDTESSGGDGKKPLEIPLKIKRDPVALYHWYKTFWGKHKAPGEDKHLQLRWNVRAVTVGRVPCDADGNPINYLTVPGKPPRRPGLCRAAC